MIYKMKTSWISYDFFRWEFVLPKKYFKLLLHIEAFRSLGYAISCIIYSIMSVVCYEKRNFFFLWLYNQIQALAASIKLSVSVQLLDLGQSTGRLGLMISSSQGPYVYTNTLKLTFNANTKHPCCEWFEPTVPASARAKRVHVLDRSATVTSNVK
jgi:hypothetical protein